MALLSLRYDDEEATSKRPTRGERDRGAVDLPALTRDQLLTAEQLAERWQVPKSHVYRLTRGRDPAVRLGRYYRYRLDEIEAFELGAPIQWAFPNSGPGARVTAPGPDPQEHHLP